MPTEDPISAAVIGEGTMATALAHVIASENRPCVLCTSDPRVAQEINERHRHPLFFAGATLAPHLVATTDLGAAVRAASLVIVAVPSSTFAAVARSIGNVSTAKQVLISATKGLDPETNARMSELLQKHTSSEAVGTISGPNITPDIIAGHLTAILVASPLSHVLEVARHMLSAPRVRVFRSTDLIGVETVSALKNVAAIATGVAIGSKLGINTESFVLTEALREVERLAAALGASRAPLQDLCGIGDIYLTCTHPLSLNRRLGIEVGKGRKLDEILAGMPEVPEGLNSLRAHVELARQYGVLSPIAEGVKRMIEGTLRPEALESLLPTC